MSASRLAECHARTLLAVVRRYVLGEPLSLRALADELGVVPSAVAYRLRVLRSERLLWWERTRSGTLRPLVSLHRIGGVS